MREKALVATQLPCSHDSRCPHFRFVSQSRAAKLALEDCTRGHRVGIRTKVDLDRWGYGLEQGSECAAF